MTQMASRRFEADVSINLAFSLIPIAVTLVSVPLYLDQIGLERYGILALVWTLTGMLAFFDFGIAKATNHYIARGHGGLDGPPAGPVILTTGTMNLALGCLLGLVFLLSLGPLVFGSINSGPDVAAEIDTAIHWIALLLPISFAASVLRSALEGKRRFVTVNLISTGGQSATILSALATAYLFGPELAGLVITILIVRICVLALWAVAVADLLAGSRFLTRAEFGSILRFGGWQALFNGLTGILSSADRFVIGWIAGAAATALFVVPFSLTSRLRIVTSSVQRVLFPKLSATRNDAERLDLGVRATEAMLLITATLTIPSILFVRPFFAVWIDAEFAVSAGPIAQVLLSASLLQAALSTLLILHTASGRPDLPAKLRMLSALPFLAMLTLGVWYFGPLGAALALLIRFATELLWTLNVFRLLSRLLVPLSSLMGGCAVAILVSRLDYGLVAGVFLSAIAMAVLTAVAAHLSKDFSRFLAFGLQIVTPQFKRER